MTASGPGRPHGLLRWLVLFLVLVGGGLAYLYNQQRQDLVCTLEGRGGWSLTYADGEHVSKFMWVIHPANQQGFLDCLKFKGYEIKTVKETGEITAFDSYGRTISNTIGDDFIQKGTFYKW